MSLDNIQLPAMILQEIYKNALVDIDPVATKKTVEKEPGISFLGSNQKYISIIVNNDSAIYLPDDALNFLIGILGACKLSMADVALVNMANKSTLSYKEISTGLNAEKIFMFGVDPSALALPLQFPHYQIQQFNGQVYLSAASLDEIVADKAEKTKLWNCLKQIFTP